MRKAFVGGYQELGGPTTEAAERNNVARMAMLHVCSTDFRLPRRSHPPVCIFNLKSRIPRGPAGKLIRKLLSRLSSSLLKERAGKLLAERRRELTTSLLASLRPELRPSLLTQLATKLAGKLGTKLLTKLDSKLPSELLPRRLRELTRWLLAGLLPMWGVELQILRLTL